MISAETKIYGIVGSPIEHSLSPLLQNTLAKEMNIDMCYTAFPVKDNIEDAIKGAFALGIQGLNVTIPYKKDLLSLVKGIDAGAKKIGAINTLVRDKDGYIGYNTDITGLKLSIENMGISLNGKNVILLGAGGAAKSALYLSIDEGAGSVTVINRDGKKAELLKREVADFYSDIRIFSLDEIKSNPDLLEFGDYFVFQTTSVGMYPKVNDCIIESEVFYKKCAQGIDLIYTPEETIFIKNMKAFGKDCINGLDMLVLQGVAAFEMWNNVKVGKDIVKKVKDILKNKLKERAK